MGGRMRMDFRGFNDGERVRINGDWWVGYLWDFLKESDWMLRLWIYFWNYILYGIDEGYEFREF